VLACAHEDPVHVMTRALLVVSSTPLAAQKLNPAQETETSSTPSLVLGNVVADHEDPFHW
jgi:hypothetical protein